MRWHCRLNHVAAHTAMLTSILITFLSFLYIIIIRELFYYDSFTVFTTDFARRPSVELEKMLTFSGIKASREDLMKAIRQYNIEIKTIFGSSNMVNNQNQQQYNSELAEAISKTIENEMKETQELTIWPCKFFRDLEKGKNVFKLPIHSKDLAANCTGDYVTCSVQYDFKGG